MNFLDQTPLGMVLLSSILIQVLFIELGFRYGKTKQGKPYKAQTAQVRAIMGSSLGLLAFMLAFSFSIAQGHFEERTRAYLMEVNAIASAYRGADLIGPENKVQAKELLKDFARLRLKTTQIAKERGMEEVAELIRESERIHDLLWGLAGSSMEGSGDQEGTGIFAQEVLAMIDAHDARLQATFFNRVSPIVWITLFLMALLSMVVMGYQAGLTGTRSRLATWTLAIMFSAVMTLITDLDRPNMTLFQMDQGLMIKLESRMGGGQSWDPAVHGR